MHCARCTKLAQSAGAIKAGQSSTKNAMVAPCGSVYKGCKQGISSCSSK